MSEMRPRIKPLKRRTKVTFIKRAANMAASAQTGSPQHSDSDMDEEFIDDTSDLGIEPNGVVPELFTASPPVRDALPTATSSIQAETVRECVPLLAATDSDIDYNAHGVPSLLRDNHVKFLQKQLGRFPAPYVAADASRPWFLYWSLNALALLGYDTAVYREDLIKTVRTMQNPSGGIGGGHGQDSHLATTYAVVLALAIVGGEDAYEAIDRKAMWKWLCSLKQPSGGIQMALGGEVDVRGAYCATVIVTLLDLPLDLSTDSPAWTPERPTLFTGLADYVRRCQTFEGGISGKPDGEAHGAYAFCALGCLSILDTPHRIIPKYLDVPRLISWLSSRQYAPEGGFSGRTNKLVDGCYSHWVGGCWPLIDAVLKGAIELEDQSTEAHSAPHEGSLYSREGLIRYILCCGQDRSKRGGLRDKPSRPSDAYHTCYVLSGLSSAQHQWDLTYFNEDETILSEPKWVASPCAEGTQVFNEEDRVGTIHPVYTIPQESVDDMKAYFASKQGL
ncbi:prenyltransferase and squalene oxidase [Colletotrichum orchidophilum]|uniref:Protein farnesyltransferase subunit beta n=1 Tax=Colletotrichum orchidophilum TaxID=1209926 RepID=A0A1G4AYM7_9PEZI|nr:prenyltransferase and squalene oxidase [Colletotrichum orchidophilum]OHE94247.1 prenyltransferase and squalene oxidase [Colletotrichum orchidophilum]